MRGTHYDSTLPSPLLLSLLFSSFRLSSPHPMPLLSIPLLSLTYLSSPFLIFPLYLYSSLPSFPHLHTSSSPHLYSPSHSSRHHYHNTFLHLSLPLSCEYFWLNNTAVNLSLSPFGYNRFTLIFTTGHSYQHYTLSISKPP